ncbi:MAG: radical SAM protein [Actinobacteria bacterium]|nr:radical SAM protein [Actinomycetota bacterium]
MTTIIEAVAGRTIGSRVWFYSNYTCNLTCSYCLTESGPGVPARELPRQTMTELSAEAAELGFRELGVTGGEPFLLSDMPERLAEMADILPVTVLTNATFFNDARLSRLEPLKDRKVWLQISLDSAEAVVNDAMRGPENFEKVVEAIPRLLDAGIGVRIASTVEDPENIDLSDLCALHRSLGVADEDHVVRTIMRRGRAAVAGFGESVGTTELFPELTVTADGAFWSPFAPTVAGGRLDTDLLVSRSVRPLRQAAETLVRLATGSGTNVYDDRFR